MSGDTKRSHVCLQPDLSPPLQTPSSHVAPGGSLEFHKSSGSDPNSTLLQQPAPPTISTRSRNLWSVGSTFTLLSQPYPICQQILSALPSTCIRHPSASHRHPCAPSVQAAIIVLGGSSAPEGWLFLTQFQGDLLKTCIRSHVTPLLKHFHDFPSQSEKEAKS